MNKTTRDEKNRHMAAEMKRKKDRALHRPLPHLQQGLSRRHAQGRIRYPPLLVRIRR